MLDTKSQANGLVTELVLQVTLKDYPYLLPEEQAFEVHILPAEAAWVPVFPVEPVQEEPKEVVEEENADETEEVDDTPVFPGVVIPTEPEKVLDETDFAANEIRE